jgi:hypothetical protein
MDLGSNFHSHQFLDFYERSAIEVKYERATGLILDGLKKTLYNKNIKKGGKWINEISSVVWGFRTQPSKATGQSPFFLVYGSEAILPTNVMWQSPQLEMYEEGEANDARLLELYSVEEICFAPVGLLLTRRPSLP